MRLVFTLLGLGALFLGGCGSDSAQQTARSYTEAIEGADWSRACSLIDSQSLERSEALYGERCEEWLQKQAGTWLKLDTEIELEPIRIESDYATFATSVSESPLLLRKEAGRWRITFFEKEQ